LDRRKFLLSCSAAVPAILLTRHTGQIFIKDKETRMKQKNYDDDYIKKLADLSISLSKKNGASYCDFRLSNFKSQRISTRENVIQGISENENYGFSVRVLVEGA